jgi:hypothetical protein
MCFVNVSSRTLAADQNYASCEHTKTAVLFGQALAKDRHTRSQSRNICFSHTQHTHTHIHAHGPVNPNMAQNISRNRTRTATGIASRQAGTLGSMRQARTCRRGLSLITSTCRRKGLAGLHEDTTWETLAAVYNSSLTVIVTATLTVTIERLAKRKAWHAPVNTICSFMIG